MKKIILSCFTAAFGFFSASAQIVGPTSGCVGTPINFSTPENKFTYHWDFNAVSVNQPLAPLGVLNTGSAGWTSAAFSCFVQDATPGSYHYFVTDYFSQYLWRLDYTGGITSPTAVTNLGTFGTAGDLEGVDIAYDKTNNHWYGLMVNYSELIQLDFGASLTNPSPVVSVTPFPQIMWGHQLTIKYYHSPTSTANWHAFVADRNGTITRFDFGPTAASLALPPTAVVSIPNVGGVTNPCNFTLYQQGSNWYMLVPSLYNDDIARYNFGTDLLNPTPTGDSLPHKNVTLTLTRPIFILNDCNNNLYAYVFNETGDIIQMDFAGDITNNPTFTDLGPTGLSNIGSGAPCAYNNQFSYLLVDFGTNIIHKYDPFVNLTPNADLDYYTQNQSTTFTTPGIYPLTLFYDMGRPSGPSVACSEIEIDKCQQPCYDPKKTSLTVVPSSTDSCSFVATVHTSTTNTIMGYTWTVSPAGITQTDVTSSPVDHFPFSIAPGTVYTVTVTVHIVDKDLDCCTGILTQTVTCNGSTSANPVEKGTSTSGFGTPDRQKAVQIYPNPASDIVTINSPIDGISTVQVIDVNGKKIGDYNYDKPTTTTISLKGLPPGTYLFKVNGQITKTILKE